MILEKIIFNLLAFAIFTVVFFRMVRKNDTNYLYLLLFEFFGILLNFIELIAKVEFNVFLKMIIYLFSIIIPLLILIVEWKKKLMFSEILEVSICKLLLLLNKNDNAKQRLFKLINKYPDSFIAHKRLADIYEKEGNIENALGEYIRLTEIDKNNIEFKYKTAELLDLNKKSEEAINTLKSLLNEKPEYYKATALLGDILIKEENYKEAISVYLNALMYNKTNYDLYYNLGIAYTLINDFAKAKEYYGKAAELNSLLYNSKYSLAQIALMYGELEEAEKFLMQSKESEDLEAGSYYYLALIAMMKGDKDKAKNYMNLAIELDPEEYARMAKDPIFIPIKNEIRKPENEKQNKKKKLTYKEIKSNEHLENTCLLMGNLNNNDITMMKNIKNRDKELGREKQE